MNRFVLMQQACSVKASSRKCSTLCKWGRTRCEAAGPCVSWLPVLLPWKPTLNWFPEVSLALTS